MNSIKAFYNTQILLKTYSSRQPLLSDTALMEKCVSNYNYVTDVFNTFPKLIGLSSNCPLQSRADRTSSGLILSLTF